MMSTLYKTNGQGRSYLTVEESELGPVVLREDGREDGDEPVFVLSAGEAGDRPEREVYLSRLHISAMLPTLQCIAESGRMPCAPDNLVPIKCRVTSYTAPPNSSFRLYQVSFSPWSGDGMEEMRNTSPHSSLGWPQLLDVTPHPTEFQVVWCPLHYAVESNLLSHMVRVDSEEGLAGVDLTGAGESRQEFQPHVGERALVSNLRLPLSLRETKEVLLSLGWSYVTVLQDGSWSGDPPFFEESSFRSLSLKARRSGLASWSGLVYLTVMMESMGFSLYVDDASQLVTWLFPNVPTMLMVCSNRLCDGAAWAAHWALGTKPGREIVRAWRDGKRGGA